MPLTVISIARTTTIAAVTPPPLVRPSALARFWGIHTRTLHGWIQQGRLAALRSPGNHVRLRVADVRAFCEREGLAVPPFVSPTMARVVVAGVPEITSRGLVRALRGGAVGVSVHEGPYDGLVAAASTPTRVLVLGVSRPKFDGPAAIRALKESPAGGGLAVVAIGARTRAAADLLEAAGATRALGRASERDLPAVVRELLALPAAAAQ
jgi:excisionase family DNA binding protein